MDFNSTHLPQPHLLKFGVNTYEVDKVLRCLRERVQRVDTSHRSELKFNIQHVGSLYAKDMELLGRPDYIDDNIINAFVQIALHNCRQQRHGLDVLGLDDIMFVDPLFVLSLNTSVGEGFAQRAVKECWLAKVILVMPYCTDQHWRLCIVNKKMRHILFMDSLHGEVDSYMLKQLFTFIGKLPDRYPADTTLRWLCEKWFNSNWTCLSAKDFKSQINNYDCGIYVIVWLSIIIDSYEINDTQVDVCLHSKYLRCRIFGIIVDSELTEAVSTEENDLSLTNTLNDNPTIQHSAGDSDAKIARRTKNHELAGTKEPLLEKRDYIDIKYTTVYPNACDNSWQYLRTLKTQILF
ncbi:sentrin-specific protease 1 [Lissonota sp. PSUC_FEM 10030012]|nr:sentrin-specific protease 1 [Lissonota sp. PSUC_FEM 10030012]